MLNPLEAHYKRAYQKVNPFRKFQKVNPPEAYQAVMILSEQLTSLKQVESTFVFNSGEEEVYYFKNYWLELESLLYYYSFITNKCIYLFGGKSKSKRIKYLRKKLNAFLVSNFELNKYYVQNASHLDNQIFLRSSHDKFILARLNAAHHFARNYLNNSIDKPTAKFETSASKNKWTLFIYFMQKLNLLDQNTIVNISDLVSNSVNISFKDISSIKSKVSPTTRSSFYKDIIAIANQQLTKDD